MLLVSSAIQLICLLAATDAFCDTSKGLEFRRQIETNCVLPEYPAFGSWSLFFNPRNFKPGMSVSEGSIILLNCESGYTLNGTKSQICENGRWSRKMGKCLASNENKNYTVQKTSLSTNLPSEEDLQLGCILPSYPLNGRWIVGNKSDLKPEMRVAAGTVLLVTCDNGYRPDTESVSVCKDDDNWTKLTSKCLKPCPSLRSTESTKVICSYGNKELQDCIEPANGTVARFECSPFYENTQLRNPFIICRDGSWSDSEVECTPICGQERVEIPIQIDGGNETYKESYPWHVAIYNKTKEFICGGALLNQRIVLTSAACVTNSQRKLEPTENFIVAVGKHYRNYDNPRDIVSAQFSKLENIIIPAFETGFPLNYYRDTAVLITKTSFKISKSVQPACVDRSEDRDLGFPSVTHGYSATWRDELAENKVLLIDVTGCLKIFNSTECAPSSNETISRCQGEKGAGLFIEYQNKHYISGIAVDPPPVGKPKIDACGLPDYTRYINVYDAYETILKIESDFKRNGTTKQAENECLLPLYPKNGQLSLVDSQNSLVPGDFVSSGFTIETICDKTYVLQGSKFLKCLDGKWNSTIGTCLAPCPPITSSRSIQVSCFSGSDTISCSNATHGSVATFKCNPFYENLDLGRNPFRTCQDGQWKPEIPNCVPMCGVKPESEEGKNYNPWNVAIYQVDGQNRTLKCAGTLINERIVLTSAQCINDDLGTKFSPKNYLIAAGDATKTEVQYNKLEDISIHGEYGGKAGRYWADIALLVTKKPFNMSENVQLACIDWKRKFSGELSEFQGSIPAPLTLQVKNQTDIEIPIIDINKCPEQLSVNSSYVTFDKICSGVVNLDDACKMNRGAGLVTKNRQDNRYYLVGIASVFFPGNCGADTNFILFTQVSKHISNFIAEANKLYTPVNTPYFQSFCGVKSVQAQTLIVGGNNVNKSEYPWQVAIYKNKPNGRKILICGGALINQRIILTAAHCVTDRNGRKLPLNQFIVAVGKNYRQFDHDDDSDSAQFSELIEIIIPPPFQGELQNYVGDIALLISEKSFVLSKNVQPVCIDWEGKYESRLLRNSVTGYVSGWGFTKQNSDPSEILKDLKVQYVDRNTCKKNLPPDYDVFLTFDKICSGLLNRSASACRGDSGGGLVFRNEIDGRYYVFGIVSLSPQAPSGGCNIQTYALYTKVSYYLKDFILQNAKLYWR